MERYSEQKEVELVAMSIKEAAVLDLFQSEGVTKCTKCKSPVRPPEYIDTYDVLHFVCDTCGYEWVE